MKFWSYLLLVVSFWTLTQSASAQLPPDKALAALKVSDGLEATLWAAEPMLVNPSIMDIDHKGRVWVGDSVNYRQRLRGEKKLRRPEGDRILVLEDTKGGGKADKVTTFFQAPEFVCPLGIAVAPYPEGGQKIYVCHSPHIYVFEDKDDDLKPDGPPKILLTGFKGFDHDHGVHGIYIGPDNKLYFSVGDQGVQNLQSSDGKGRKWTSNGTDCRAGTIWRCDLDGKNLELLAHNFRNNYEPCMDSFGNLWISDNDDDGNDQVRICYVMPGGNYGYHPRGKGQTHWHEEQPGIVPKVLRTFRGSPCGMCFYEGTLLPKKYWGQPLHVDAGPGRLSCYHLKPKGAGYEIDREDMVTSKDSFFRPSDVTVAPDGAVFICDWYDQGVGGHAARNLEDGRIYRIAPVGNKPKVPKVDLESKEGLIAALDSPNLAVRYLAMAKSQARKLELKTPELKAVVAAYEQKEKPLLRARAAWLLSYTNAEYGFLKVLGDFRGDKDDRFRVQAVRMEKETVEGMKKSGVGSLILYDFAEAAVKDPSPAVRREALLLLQDTGQTYKHTIINLAKQYDGKDRFYLAAIGIAVGPPGISKEIDQRREIILADFEKHFPEWNEKVAGLLWELRPTNAVAILEKHLASRQVHVNQRGLIIDILATTPGPEAGPALLRTLASELPLPPDVQERALFHLREHLSGKWNAMGKSPLFDKAIDQLLKDPHGKVTALGLMAAAQNGKRYRDIIQLADDAKEPLTVRLAAVRALASFDVGPSKQTCDKIMGDKTQPEILRAEAIKTLSREWSWLTIHLTGVPSNTKDFSLELRQTALAGIAAHKAGADNLLQSYTSKMLPEDLTPDLARLLRNSPFPDIKKKANAVLPPPPKFDPKKLPSIPALLARKGNLEKGRKVLDLSLKSEVSCLKCHTIGGVGGQVGPDLTSIGAKASRENLMESILYPSRAIADQFAQWQVETQGGLVVNGLIVEEAPDFLVVRDANAKDYKIAKKDLDKKIKLPASIMPDNLITFMSEDELLDLVDYLYSLKETGGPPVFSALELPGPAPQKKKGKK